MTDHKIMQGVEAAPVHITGSDVPLGHAAPHGRTAMYETFVLTANDQAMCILPEDPDREIAYIQALDNDIVIGSTSAVVKAAANTTTSTATSTAANPTPNQPSVPATGVAQQNVNAYPVQVVITAGGATISNVSVNGITVGTAAGTYVVPAFGSISIAYTVATPTWVWSDANPAVVTTVVTVPNPNGTYVPKSTIPYPNLDNQAVYAGVTTTSSNSRVAVAAYYRAKT